MVAREDDEERLAEERHDDQFGPRDGERVEEEVDRALPRAGGSARSAIPSRT
jgi:hypothetical protein